MSAIALNEARRGSRRAKSLVSIGPGEERSTTLNTSAIDVATIFALCRPECREILQAQLEGISAASIAEEQCITPTAIRIRAFRARRAARALCQPTSGNLAASLDERKFQDMRANLAASRMNLARRHLEIATTFVRLLDLTLEKNKRDRLLLMTGKALTNTLKALSGLVTPEVELSLLRAAARGLRQRISKQSSPSMSVDRAHEDLKSVTSWRIQIQ